MKKVAVAFVLVLLTIGQAYSQTLKDNNVKNMRDVDQPDHYTFK